MIHSEKKKKAVLLINVGTPDKPEVKSVRRFLTEFLNDPYVITMPWLFRVILVNLIIVPFRASKSTKLYKQLWEKEGSPLLTNAMKLQDKLAVKIGEDYKVYFAMRYGNPSINKALSEIEKGDFEEIIIVPLFPQYALSTSETAIQKVYKEAKKFKALPKLRVIHQFYSHPSFIHAWVARVKEFDLNFYDHIIFSYHGLPLTHIAKIHPQNKIKDCNCETEMPTHGKLCYKASVHATTRLLVKELGLNKDQYSVGFQSRLTNHWLSPFTDELIMDLAKRGHKKMLIISPAFVADCLETNVELGIEYAELFLKEGGEKLDLVKSLNDSPAWVNALDQIIKSN